MYLLTKSILAVMLGFISAVVLGFILIPILKKMHAGQRISSYVANRHQSKEGTPTLGGLIFILPTLLVVLGLLITGKMELTEDLKIALFTKNENIQRWDFIKYIPHIFTDEKDIRLFASNDNEAKYVSNYLEEIIKFRKEQKEESNNKDVVPMPYFLVITDDYSNKRNIGFFEDFINKDLNSLGFSLLVIDDDLKNVPSSSNTFIEVREKDGVILERQTGLNEQTIFYI